MPDISMCDDKSCHMRRKCYRYMAKPFPICQTYFLESPRQGDQCAYFWEINGRSIREEKQVSLEEENGTDLRSTDCYQPE